MLRPGGAIAIWTYDLGTFVGEPEATAAFVNLFQERLGKYWDPRMLQAMDNKYEGADAEKQACASPNAALTKGNRRCIHHGAAWRFQLGCTATSIVPALMVRCRAGARAAAV